MGDFYVMMYFIHQAESLKLPNYFFRIIICCVVCILVLHLFIIEAGGKIVMPRPRSAYEIFFCAAPEYSKKIVT